MAPKGRLHRAAHATTGSAALEEAHQRHEQLMRVYRDAQASKSTVREAVPSHDMVVLERNFQFIRDEQADLDRSQHDWQVRLSVRYYNKLFREYALADLSKYKEGKVALRWRTEMEVVSGKGQFTCGNKKCDVVHGLHSYELLFAYVEHGEQKKCLVKVRVCEDCARKLFNQKLKRYESDQRREEKKMKTKKEAEEDQEVEDGDSGRTSGSKNQKRRRPADSKDDDPDHHKRRRHQEPRGDNKRSRRSHSRASEGDRTGEDVHAMCAKINKSEAESVQFAGAAGSQQTQTHSEKAERTSGDDDDSQLRRLLL